MEDNATGGAAERAADVMLYVDPCCPFAWITSRWIAEVERIRGIDVEIRLVSLAVVNEGQDLEPWYREFNDRAWRPARVFAAIDRGHGSDRARAFYDEFGRRFHIDRVEDLGVVVPRALDAARLPARLADAGDDAAWDEVLRASTAEALGPVGIDVGTPILHLDGTAVFGPVLSACPSGQAAVAVFDAVRVLAGEPAFSELNRRRPETLDRSEPGAAPNVTEVRP